MWSELQLHLCSAMRRFVPADGAVRSGPKLTLAPSPPTLWAGAHCTSLFVTAPEASKSATCAASATKGASLPLCRLRACRQGVHGGRRATVSGLGAAGEGMQPAQQPAAQQAVPPLMHGAECRGGKEAAVARQRRQPTCWAAAGRASTSRHASRAAAAAQLHILLRICESGWSKPKVPDC